jgi:uncharacterized protein YecT (DUF1311 family)
MATYKTAIIGIAVMAGLSVATAGAAQSSRYSETFTACVAAPGNDGLTQNLRDCYDYELDYQTGVLEAVHAAYVAKAPASRRAKISRSQTLWQQRMDSRCSAEADDGGTLGQFSDKACRLDAVVARIALLRKP